MQCTNHLKQVGLGVHNFENTRRAVPPSVIGAYSRLTFWFLILPYIEQQAAYNLADSTNNGLGLNAEGAYNNANPNANGDLPGANADEKIEFMRGLARIPIYYCPSRRAATGTLTTGARPTNLNPGGGVNYCRDGWPTPERWAHGPSSDYAVPGVMYDDFDGTVDNYATTIAALTNARPLQHDVLSAGNYAMYPGWDNMTMAEASPFRASTHSNPDKSIATNNAAMVRTWQPRDEISWWADGTSNQIIAGEKYMMNDDLYTHMDSTWLWFHGDTWAGTMRIFHYYVPFGRNVREEWECHHSHKRFGGPHPGITNFVLGDGSVRGVAPTTPNSIMIPLCHVNDGNSVTLP